MVKTVQGDIVWKRAHSFVFLGTSTTATADAAHTLHYRLSRADGYVRVHMQAFGCDAIVAEKLKFWCESAQAVANFGTSHLHLTQSLLQAAKAWEFKWLRRLCRMRRSPVEDYRTYLSRTSKKITQAFIAANRRPLHQRMLVNALRLLMTSSATLRSLQTVRTCTFKHLVARIPYKRRKLEALLQSKTGYRYKFIDVFKKAWGDDWVRKVEERQGRKARETELITIITYAWHFPSPQHPLTKLHNFIHSSPKQLLPHPTEITFASLHNYLPEVHPNDRHCHRGIRQLQIVTDSQFLAHVFNGRAQFKAANDFQAVYSILDECELAWKAGWFPRQLIEPMIPWRARTRNTLADHVANFAASH